MEFPDKLLQSYTLVEIEKIIYAKTGQGVVEENE